MDIEVKDDMYMCSRIIFLFQLKIVSLNHAIKFRR